METDAVYRFERPARTGRAIGLVALIWIAIVGLYLIVEAAVWIVGLVAVLTVPAILDIVSDARASIEVDRDTFRWASGRRGRTVRLAAIDEVVLTTALDFSQRAKVLLTSGERYRVPPECLPPGRALDAILERRGIPHRRGLFSL